MFINDRTTHAPRLRKDLNFATYFGLHSSSEYYRRHGGDLRRACVAEHIESVQARDPKPLIDYGLKVTGMARIMNAGDLDALVHAHSAMGLEATTLHLGDGFESDDDIDCLVGAMLDASQRYSYPLFLETHRATITQDMQRTLQMIGRFPEVRFNADVSHWYTGQELPYGNFAAKLDRLEPFFKRVGFMHGRVGDSGCMQRSVASLKGSQALPHYRELWRRCFQGFLQSASAGDVLPFAIELLPNAADLNGARIELNYARLVQTNNGEWVEESDRWTEIRLLWTMANTEFAAAQTHTVI